MTRLIVMAAIAAAWLYPPHWSPTARVATAQEKTDRDLIQGSWRVLKLERNGKAGTGPFREDTWVFKGDEVRMVRTVGEGKTFFTATFKLDPSKNPKTIEMVITDGVANVGDKSFGIYRIDGDKLTICRGREFPKEFSGKGETGLLELERVKRM